MVEPATRVALLARPGAACDNLQAALRQAGADVVAVQDPGDGDPGALAAARPAAVLVALEPAVESALERYDAVLSEPGRLVIYDEVAIAARREGWDAARWARHLAAKLGGHGDVLPPGAGADQDPGVPAPRAAAGVAAPATIAATPPAPPAPEAAAPPAPEPVLELAPEPITEPTRDPGNEPASVPVAEVPAFDADSVHLGLVQGHEEGLAQVGNGIDFGGFTPEMMAAMAMEPMAPPAGNTESLDGGDDAGSDGAGDAQVLEWDAPAPEQAPAPSAPSELELAPEAPAAAPATAAAAPRFSASEMSLVDIEPVATPGSRHDASATAGSGDGAVVVLAGIGGPDAVRQFLAALPGGFARPIIVRQRLDGGRHDRLVKQMQRATALPVELAEAGRTLVAGHVYILPDGMTTASEGGAPAFQATAAPVPVLAGLPAAESAIFVLSGTDPAIVPEAMDAAREGALVLGQSPEDSFDGAAAAALVAAGGEARGAAELAQRLSTRWLSLKD